MKIKVTDKSAILLEDDTLIQNSTDTYNVTFLFSKDWDGFAKTVMFSAGSITENLPLTDDCCTIPANCLQCAGVNLRIGVFGGNGMAIKGINWCLAGRILYPLEAAYLVSSSPLCGIADGIAQLQEEHQTISDSIDELKALVEEGTSSEAELEYATDEEVSEMIQDILG